MDEDNFFLPLPPCESAIVEAKAPVHHSFKQDSEDSLEIPLLKNCNKTQLEKAVTKVLKKGQLFEIRKKTRRIKLLKNRKGADEQTAKNETKIQRIVRQIEDLKNISVAGIVGRVVDVLGLDVSSVDTAKLTCTEMCEESETLKQISPDIESIFDTSDPKLVISEKIKTRLIELIREYQSLKLNNCSEPDTLPAQGENKTCIQNAKPNILTKKEKNSTSENINKKVSDAVPKVDNSSKTLENKNMLAKEKDKSNVLVSPKNNVESDLNCETKIERKHKKVGSKNRKIQVEQQRVESRTVPKQKNERSKLFSAKELTKGNRLGQRARRALWEKMYGSQAAHVKANLPLRVRRNKETLKNYKQGESIAGNTIRRDKNQSEDAMMPLKNLHPSWQAKKLQKQQFGIVEFQGSKLTFEV